MYAVFVVDYANVSPLPSTLNDICRSSLTSEFSPKVYNIALLLHTTGCKTMQHTNSWKKFVSKHF